MENNKQLELIKVQSFNLPDEAIHIVIINDESLREANKFYQGCKTIVENIHRHMDPIRDANYTSWKESIKLIQKLEEFPLQAMKTVKPKMIAYKQKVQDAIDKKAEAARAKIEAERKKQEKLLEDAAALEKTGDKDEAEEKFEAAEKIEEKVGSTIQRMENIPEAPKLEGTTIRKIPQWKMIKFADVPEEYLKEEIDRLDSVKIGKMVRASSGTVKIPGIEVYFKSV